MLKLIFFSSLLLFLTACSTKESVIKHTLKAGCEFYSLKTALCLDKKELTETLAPYQIIFIGDHHTEDDMHLKVAQLITALSDSGVKVHLANEWFYPSDQKTLDKFVNNDLNETEFLKKIQWKKRLKFNKYASFKPMYQAIKHSHGQLHGINLSKEERKKISTQNLSKMGQDERQFNNSLDLKVMPHKELIMPFLSHCHAPKKEESIQQCKERMYRVQVAWDSKMALETYKLSQELKTDEKLIVFAGSMHIETGLGIPLRFARLSKQPFVTIIPFDEKTEEIDNDTGDIILLYKAKEEAK